MITCHHLHPLYRLGCISSLWQWELCQLRLQDEASPEDASLHQGLAILGGKSPATLGQPTTPVGSMCERAKRIYGATDVIHWWGSPHQGNIIPLGEGSSISTLWTSWTWNHVGMKCSRCWRAHTSGSFPVTHSMGCSKVTITLMANTSTVSSQMTGTMTISSQWAKTPLGSPITQRQIPLPSFAEIARSLREMTPHA